MSGGTYRINTTEFPAPATSWEEIPIEDGLNAIPILQSYRRHTWTWDGASGCDMQYVAALLAEQQDSNAQLTALETDEYSASGATERYGTVVYDDFTIVEFPPRRRLMSGSYDSLTLTFEVYIS